jgi:beta-phosphoglucomutase-like phosphatase (HAD superfamily)
MLGVAPEHAAVFEDALAGVQAGSAGSFGHVVGVDRAGQREALLAHGASVVVGDLAELL